MKKLKQMQRRAWLLQIQQRNHWITELKNVKMNDSAKDRVGQLEFEGLVIECGKMNEIIINASIYMHYIDKYCVWKQFNDAVSLGIKSLCNEMKGTQ